MRTEPRQEHPRLHELIGEWSCDTEMAAGPGQRPERRAGTETVRPVGNLWVIAESTGEAPEGAMMDPMTTWGYDPVRTDFVGTRAGSMTAIEYRRTPTRRPAGRAAPCRNGPDPIDYGMKSRSEEPGTGGIQPS